MPLRGPAPHAVVLGFVTDIIGRAQILAGLRGFARVEFCRGVALVDAITELRPSVLIVQLRDEHGQSTVAFVSALVNRFPTLPIVAYATWNRDGAHDILAAGRAGARGLILQGCGDVASAVRPVLPRARHARSIALAKEIVRQRVPAKLVTLFDHCLARADRCTRVEELATAFGVTRRALAHRLASAGLPTPSAVQAWCRLLLAAGMIEDGNDPVERIAHELDFASAAAMRNMLRRYTGLRVGQVRRDGGLVRVAGAFASALRARQRALDAR